MIGEHKLPSDWVELDWVELDSRIGALLVVATPTGVALVAYREGDARPAADLVLDRLGPAVRAPNAMLQRASDELDAWFEDGTPLTAPIDWRLAGTGFRAEVWRYLPEIPSGEVRSYGEVAEDLGRPRAFRAVGSSCATNPVPLFSPCHRVVRADGSIGSYGMQLGRERGRAVKRTLLELEGVALDGDVIVRERA